MASRQSDSFWKLTNGIGSWSSTVDDFGGVDAPKQKFLFTVKFYFRNGDTMGGETLESMDFGVKQTTRPNPSVSYQDVNFYNFRTKVATKVEYGTVAITFYDDNKNKAHDIFEQYLTTLSPIASVPRELADILDGMGQSRDGTGSASVGELTNNRHGIISSIRVTHHYNEWYSPDGDDKKKIHYDYLNPKITTMTLDELDMTQSEAPTVTFNFTYDGVNIVKE